jgi:hypothetical protein
MDDLWDDVRNALSEAKGMYWDGCHKIYLAMDDKEVDIFADYGYDYHEPDFDLLRVWFEQSCWLRFVNAVSYNEKDPNAGYEQLIPQFAFEEEEDFE